MAIRLIKNKGLKQNETLGKTILIVTTIYFTYTALTYILSNLTDNQGGWLKVVLALLLSLIAIPLGLVIKNGTKEY